MLNTSTKKCHSLFRLTCNSAEGCIRCLIGHSGTRAFGESLPALRCLHTSRTSPNPPPTTLWQGLKARVSGRFASYQSLTHVMLASRTHAAIKFKPAGDKNADKSFIPGYWRDKYLSSLLQKHTLCSRSHLMVMSTLRSFHQNRMARSLHCSIIWTSLKSIYRTLTQETVGK